MSGCLVLYCIRESLFYSDPYPDLNPDPDPHVFGPPGTESGTISRMYGSGSGSFNQQAKKVRKTLIPTAL